MIDTKFIARTQANLEGKETRFTCQDQMMPDGTFVRRWLPYEEDKKQQDTAINQSQIRSAYWHDKDDPFALVHGKEKVSKLNEALIAHEFMCWVANDKPTVEEMRLVEMELDPKLEWLTETIRLNGESTLKFCRRASAVLNANQPKQNTQVKGSLAVLGTDNQWHITPLGIKNGIKYANSGTQNAVGNNTQPVTYEILKQAVAQLNRGVLPPEIQERKDRQIGLMGHESPEAAERNFVTGYAKTAAAYAALYLDSDRAKVQSAVDKYHASLTISGDEVKAIMNDSTALYEDSEIKIGCLGYIGTNPQRKPAPVAYVEDVPKDVDSVMDAVRAMSK